MAHDESARRAVRAAYVHEALPLEAAAEKHHIPVSTARRWKRAAKADGDDWDKARAAARMAGSGMQQVAGAVVEDFILLFQTTLDALKASEGIHPMEKAEAISRLSDAFSKTVKASGMADPALSRLSLSMEVLEALGGFINERFPQHGPAFLEILEPFGVELAKRYG
jgi:hypothetical protein